MDVAPFHRPSLAPANVPVAQGGLQTYWVYGVALGVIALATLLSGWLLSEMAARQRDNASVVNLAGMQRTVSQRVAATLPSLAAPEAGQGSAERTSLTQLLRELMDHHDRLTAGPNAPARRSAALSEHYFGPAGIGTGSGATGLDAKLRAFVVAVSNLDTAARRGDALDPLQVQALRDQVMGPLLAQLHQAVLLHEAHAQQQVDGLVSAHRWALVGILLLLAAEAVFIFRPMAKRVRSQAQALMREAQTDPLTGLLNRRALAAALERQVVGGAPVSLIAIEIEGLQQINDARGQAAGDALLLAMATRLTSCVGASDVVARLSGGGFAVMLVDPDTRPVPRTIAYRIEQRLAETVAFDGGALRLACSLALASAPEDAPDAASLLRVADEALRRTKRYGRGSIGEAGPEDAARVQREAALVQALAQIASGDLGGLRVVFQPIVDVSDRSARPVVVAVEALVRWEDALLGRVAPDELLAVAKRHDHMVSLGLAIWRLAFEGFARLRRQLGGTARLCLNLSAAELESSRLVDQIETLALEFGVPLQRIELEITEEIQLATLAKETLLQLRQLRDRGVSLSMDDFGTGTSGLSQLLALPFDTIKIDRLFVQAMGSDPRATNVIEATLALAAATGMHVVAEGVETEEQALSVIAAGCRVLQGYLYSRPLSSADLQAWLEHDPHDRSVFGSPVPR
jgi:diguanylate cyclase (GGDEF)-like protein